MPVINTNGGRGRDKSAVCIYKMCSFWSLAIIKALQDHSWEKLCLKDDEMAPILECNVPYVTQTRINILVNWYISLCALNGTHFLPFLGLLSVKGQWWKHCWNYCCIFQAVWTLVHHGNLVWVENWHCIEHLLFNPKLYPSLVSVSLGQLTCLLLITVEVLQWKIF